MPRRTSKRIRKRSPRPKLTATFHQWTVDTLSDEPDPWAAVDAIVQREIEPTGPEWFTVDQFAQRYKVSPVRARAICTQFVKAGKFRHWQGTAATTRRTTNKYAPA